MLPPKAAYGCLNGGVKTVIHVKAVGVSAHERTNKQHTFEEFSASQKDSLEFQYNYSALKGQQMVYSPLAGDSNNVLAREQTSLAKPTICFSNFTRIWRVDKHFYSPVTCFYSPWLVKYSPLSGML
ncbi:hypothetical protein V1264_022361 [Littorina saxatilis]|uniref:Uncharacterized protein n=1 Tax=Littorina saxatilis TaxID=31220 RepID=A0AAN9AK61_9CAEN